MISPWYSKFIGINDFRLKFEMYWIFIILRFNVHRQCRQIKSDNKILSVWVTFANDATSNYRKAAIIATFQDIIAQSKYANRRSTFNYRNQQSYK